MGRSNIHHNPVKRDYVDEAKHWRSSSLGVNFDTINIT
jgi:hypothetical protein